MKPNFIIIGAARSGTTSLYKYLENHPDVFMSEIKEINFFSNSKYWSKGIKWYLKHFSEARTKSIGEASTSYTAAPCKKDVPSRMHNTLGNIKLIYLLRDPIDRLISHYLHYIHRGERETPIEELLKRKEPQDMLTQGQYAYQLELYLEYYPRSNIHLVNISDLKNNTEKTVKDIYNFLDIDSSKVYNDTSMHHNTNAHVTQKTVLGKKLLNFYHNQIEQRRIPYPIKKIFVSLANVGSEKIEKPDLSGKVMKALFDYYVEDVKKLRNEYGVNTTSWANFKDI